MPDRHIVAVGGGDPGLVLDYVLGLVGEGPSLLWVGTAGAEDPWNALQVHDRFHGRADVRRLEFFPWPPESLRELVLAQDVILVGGGNTANMLAIWRVHGLDRALRRAWEAGVSVPYPVEQTDHGLLMEFIGDESIAAPKLGQARLSGAELATAWEQLLANLRALTGAGLVHADLSAYNLLWWDGRLVLIDLPQAVEFTTNTDAFELLHRDVANVGEWFTRRGVAVDVEATYAELLALAW